MYFVYPAGGYFVRKEAAHTNKNVFHIEIKEKNGHRWSFISCKMKLWELSTKNICGCHKPVYSFQTHLQGSLQEVPGATPKTVAPKLFINYNVVMIQEVILDVEEFLLESDEVCFDF